MVNGLWCNVYGQVLKVGLGFIVIARVSTSQWRMTLMEGSPSAAAAADWLGGAEIAFADQWRLATRSVAVQWRLATRYSVQ